MKKLLIALLLGLPNILLAQTKESLLKVTPFIRYDRHPSFKYSVGPLDTPSVALNGVSWGIAAAYKMALTPKLYLRLGAGYYRQSFDDINTTNRFGQNSRRPIDFPSTLSIAFYTDRCWYNCLFASLGLEKQLELSKTWRLSVAANVDQRFTISQGYHITYNNSNNPIVNPYQRKDNHPFSLAVALHAGVWKKIDRFMIGPTVILPVFDRWRQDDAFFGENDEDSRKKLFRGVGIGMTINYSLTKTKTL